MKQPNKTTKVAIPAIAYWQQGHSITGLKPRLATLADALYFAKGSSRYHEAPLNSVAAIPLFFHTNRQGTRHA